MMDFLGRLGRIADRGEDHNREKRAMLDDGQGDAQDSHVQAHNWLLISLLGAAVVAVMAVAMLFVIVKRRRKAASPLTPEPPLQIECPPASVRVAQLQLQPATPPPSHITPQLPLPLSGRIGTPASPGLQRSNRPKGLLERRSSRGSNASLTIELTPVDSSSNLSICGTPPKECSAEEYLTSAGNRLTRRQLRTCLKDLTKTFHQEFVDIPNNPGPKLDISGAVSKNRYKSMWPNEHTRVRLPPPPPPPRSTPPTSPLTAFAPSHMHCEAADAFATYVNANYIRGYDGEPRSFVATQGPLPNTIVDFWSMVFAERAPAIVMMTKLREKQKIKCEPYVPLRDCTYGNIHVSVRSTTMKNGYHVRDIVIRVIDAASPSTAAHGTPSSNVQRPSSITVADSPRPTSMPVPTTPSPVTDPLESPSVPSEQPRRLSPPNYATVGDDKTWHLKHYWFTAWPDQMAPRSTVKQLLELSQEVEAERTRRKANLPDGAPPIGPVVVHCSAGIGRTGCFIGTTIGMKQMREENSVDILGIVCQMRLDRGGMVQNLEQYEFLHHALALYEKQLPETPGSAGPVLTRGSRRSTGGQ